MSDRIDLRQIRITSSRPEAWETRFWIGNREVIGFKTLTLEFNADGKFNRVTFTMHPQVDIDLIADVKEEP